MMYLKRKVKPLRKHFIIILVLIILIFLWNQVVYMKYDIFLIDYIKYSFPITLKEKMYLSDRKKIIIGTDITAPPISYYDLATGKYSGLIVDYVNFISLELGVPIDIQMYTFYDLVENLKQRKIDACDMFPSKGRSQLFDFSMPIYRLKTVIIVDENQKEINGPLDLAGKTVSIPKGDLAEEYISDLLEEANKPPAKFIYKSNTKDVIELLSDKKVDVAIGDEAVISTYWKEYSVHSTGRYILKPLYEKNVIFAVNKNEKLLLSLLNKGILQMKKKEIVPKVQQKWFGISESIRGEKNYLSTMFYFGIIFLSLVLGLYIWNFSLKKRVIQKTEEIQNARKNLSLILNNLDIGFFISDDHFFIMDCNRSAEHLLEIPKQQLLGKNIAEIVFFEKLLEEIRKNKFYNTNMSYQNKLYEVKVSHFIDEGKNMHLIGVEDITEKTIAEKKIKQEGKMIAIGQLSAGLAHEIRNPLGIIRNYLYVLKSKNKSVESQYPIRMMETSIQRINDLIEHLLSFSKISKEDNGPQNIQDILESILKILEQRLNNYNIQYTVKIEGEKIVFLNEESLKIIFINLIENAIDSLKMKKGERLLDINIKNQRNNILMEIRDSGEGICKENIDHVFNPFFTTKDTEGTGLGLYIVYNEVKRFGGEIEVNSEPGQGSIFKIFIQFGGDE